MILDLSTADLVNYYFYVYLPYVPTPIHVHTSLHSMSTGIQQSTMAHGTQLTKKEREFILQFCKKGFFLIEIFKFNEQSIGVISMFLCDLEGYGNKKHTGRSLKLLECNI